MTRQRAPRGTRAKWLADNQGLHFCACGCEQPVRLRPEHYSQGIPKFLHGHNPRVTHIKPKPDASPCECGCGELATPGRRFISGHNRQGASHTAETRAKIARSKVGENNPQHGKVPHNYKGSFRHPDGYTMIHSPAHPFGGVKGYVMEHRLVVERHLRDTDPMSPHLVTVAGERYLAPEFEVHHIDEVKSNNTVGNLRVLTKADHAALHWRLRKGLADSSTA